MPQQQRRLATILAADVAGYSLLMAADEAGTLARFKHLQADVIEPKTADFNGGIVGSAGDSLRNSSLTYKGRAVDVKQVGRELCVRYLLEGSVRQAENRMRVT